MRSILFVDDEPRLLGGLRRMLRGLRHQWRMDFAASGEEALRRLDEASYDVVVSDMRMPGMDGSQLLEQVMVRHPGVVRLVLSGHCDRQGVVKAVGPAHQFLTKPCDGEALKATLGRACGLRDRIRHPEPKNLVSMVRSVASVPERFRALLAELSSSDGSVDRAAEAVAGDVGMSVKVLQLVNSGFFGVPQRVTDPAQAVRLLGMETLRELAERARAFETASPAMVSQFPLLEVVEHSRAVARLAGEIAESETDDPRRMADAYWAGFLHDVGILVLAGSVPDQYAEVLAESQRTGEPLSRLEERTFHADHGAIGGFLLALWGLPEELVSAAARHHAPSLAADEPVSLEQEGPFSALCAVHVANCLVDDPLADRLGLDRELDHEYLASIGHGDRLDTWTELAREQCNESELAS